LLKCWHSALLARLHQEGIPKKCYPLEAEHWACWVCLVGKSCSY
jgi:hypothetical protein